MSDTMPKGATITEMDAGDLIGRLVINSHGAEFIVSKLTFEARNAIVLIWVDEIDEETGRGMGRESGLIDLDGWTIHQRLVEKR